MSLVGKEVNWTNLLVKPKLNKYDPIKVNIINEKKRANIVDKRKEYKIDASKIANKVNVHLGMVVNKKTANQTNVIPTEFKMKDVSPISSYSSPSYDENKENREDLDKAEESFEKEGLDKHKNILDDIPEERKDEDEPEEKPKDEDKREDNPESEYPEEETPPDVIESIMPEPEPFIDPGSKKRRKRIIIEETPTPEDGNSKPNKKREKRISIIETPPTEKVEEAEKALKLKERIPHAAPISLREPTYYMNTRKMYTQKLAEMFKDYNLEIVSEAGNITCDNRGTSTFELMIHQKVVRDYLNLYTPYRGLLIYHGLGSGKTCTSIAIAEGMKSHNKVIVMTPASLASNFFEQLKTCGDEMYRRNQYWEFISIEGRPEYVGLLSDILSLPRPFILKNKGAWMVDAREKKPNYNTLSEEDQKSLNLQIDAMIHTKYEEVHYNGISKAKTLAWTKNLTHNPFENSVVVIDEAHNFVSKIIGNMDKPDSQFSIMYKYLLSAQNSRIILLSGTPIINHPREIAVMFNILRGYIKTWTFNIMNKSNFNAKNFISELDKNGVYTYDFIDFTDGKLTITRNPFGFINVNSKGEPNRKKASMDLEKEQKGKGVAVEDKAPRPSDKILKLLEENPTTDIQIKLKIDKSEYSEKEVENLLKVSDADSLDMDNFRKANEDHVLNYHKGEDQYGGAVYINSTYKGVTFDDELGHVSDDIFIDQIKKTLSSMGVSFAPTIHVKNYTCLPDAMSNKKKDDKKKETFADWFIEDTTNKFINEELFKRRILGLTSYFRSAQENLLPSYVLSDSGTNYHLIKTSMSDYQFSQYSEVRMEEIDREKQNLKRMVNGKGDEDDTKLASYRMGSRQYCNFVFPPEIPRPHPPKKNITQEVEEAKKDNEVHEDGKEDDEPDEKTYAEELKQAFLAMKSAGTVFTREGLKLYSPKFLEILENMTSKKNVGLHLLYSNFRNVEGIELFKMVLDANGFSQFKIKRHMGTWVIDENENEKDEDKEKPKYVLYTGTEQEEEKTIILNIYNGKWDLVPNSISKVLKERAENNNLGEVIKVIMITAAGAEGIDLKNTRFVHIMEPYWHMVRLDQVVGRARRICSHKDLPKDLRTVQVFLYMSEFTNEQKTNRKNIELIMHDTDKTGNKNSTDEYLYGLSMRKDILSSQILKAVKESAMDCALYKKGHQKENLVCYGFPKVNTNDFSSYPKLEVDANIKDDMNLKKEDVKLVKMEIKSTGQIFARNTETNELYDWGAYQNGQLVLVAELINQNGKMAIKMKK